MKEMGLDFYKMGVKDKFPVFCDFIKKFNLQASEVIYIGDDVIDIKVLKSVIHSFAPLDASTHVLKIVSQITKSSGGEGVLREVIEMIILRNPNLKAKFNMCFAIE